jgi:hypothetical protein
VEITKNGDEARGRSYEPLYDGGLYLILAESLRRHELDHGCLMFGERYGFTPLSADDAMVRLMPISADGSRYRV